MLVRSTSGGRNQSLTRKKHGNERKKETRLFGRSIKYWLDTEISQRLVARP